METDRQGKLFYSMGEVCRHLNLLPHVLRYWEKKIGLEIYRSARGRRLFRRRDVEQLSRVSELLKEGYDLNGARKWLQGRAPFRASAGVGTLEWRTTLRELKQELDRLRALLDKSIEGVK